MTIDSTNARHVIFSSRTGLACGLTSQSSGLRDDTWGAATVASCLLAAGKKPRLLYSEKTSVPERFPWRWRAWVMNHYRWVIWKLAAVSRRFSVNRLTFKHVIAQLMWRFEREVELSILPALRAICRRDAAASHFLVLAVSRIHGKDGQQNGLIELTDGWYSIDALLDPQLTARCACGQIHVGTKLAIQGAKLVGDANERDLLDVLVQARPAPPALSLHLNGTRLARSSARLGFREKTATLVIPLSCLRSTGGAVPATDALVRHICLRSRPAQPPNFNESIPIGLVTLIGQDGPDLLLTAELRLYESDMHKISHKGLQEGDEIRVYETIAIAHTRGRLTLKSTPDTRYIIKRSPASRHLLATCGCVMRDLLDGAMLANLGGNNQKIGSRVDCLGFVIAMQENNDNVTIVLYDKSPNLLFLTNCDLRNNSLDGLADIKVGSQVAVLNALLLQTRCNAAFLECDEFAIFCRSQHDLSQEITGFATSSFRTRWEALAVDERTQMARETALEQLRTQFAPL